MLTQRRTSLRSILRSRRGRAGQGRCEEASPISFSALLAYCPLGIADERPLLEPQFPIALPRQPAQDRAAGLILPAGPLIQSARARLGPFPCQKSNPASEHPGGSTRARCPFRALDALCGKSSPSHCLYTGHLPDKSPPRRMPTSLSFVSTASVLSKSYRAFATQAPIVAHVSRRRRA